MKPLQAQLICAMYELSLGLIMRDLEPLAMAPLEEKLASLELPPSAVFAAYRSSVRGSLRALRVAFHGIEGAPEVSEGDQRAFNVRWSELGFPGSRQQASKECQSLLRYCDAIFALDDLDEPLLYQTIAYCDAIQSTRSISLQVGIASKGLLEAIGKRLGDRSPLMAALRIKDLLLGGMLAQFVGRLSNTEPVRSLLLQVSGTDEASLKGLIGDRRATLESQLSAADGDVKRQVLRERIGLFDNLALSLPGQLAVAHELGSLRVFYNSLMAPVLNHLDELYRAIEGGTDYSSGEHEALGVGPQEEAEVERYAMPLEGVSLREKTAEELPQDAEEIFNTATREFMAHRYNKAIRLFNRAIDLDPTMASAHFNLSQTYLRRGQWSNALASYQQAVFCDNRLRMVPPDYEIEEILGAGGMGILFRARQALSGDVVTLRVIKPSLTAEPARIKGFVERIKEQRAVDSPALIPVVDLKKFKAHHVLVCDYAPGQSLRGMLEVGPLTSRLAVQVMRQVVECMVQAHAVGVFHGGLKPSCVFVDAANVRIGEWGLMYLLGDDPAAAARLGIPTEYLAPEQLKGEPISEAADVFAMAGMFYEMLYGQRWRPGNSFTDDGKIPKALATRMNHALAHEPLERGHADGLLELLRELAPGSATRTLRRPLG